nr:hypothetical protein [Tanacetum cinerariifolium]
KEPERSGCLKLNTEGVFHYFC